MENKNTGGELPFGPRQLKSLLATPDGRALLSLLSRDNGAAFRAAAEAFRAGDYEGAVRAAAPLLNTPEAAELLGRLGGKLGGHE